MSVALNWQSVRPAVPIGKVSGYFDLPAFNFAVAWLGASSIVAQYNFSTTRPFVLRSLPAKPTGVNYLLCIKYRVGDTVYRYRLWQHPDCTLIAEDYSGQIIRKNAVLEIWSVSSSATASQVTPVRIYTGLLRVVADFSVAPADFAECSTTRVLASEVAASLTTAPALPAAAFQHNCDIPPNNPVDSWTDLSGNGRHLTQGVVGSRPAASVATFGVGDFTVVDFDGVNDFLQGPILASASGTIYLVINQVAWTLLRNLLGVDNNLLRLRQFAMTPNISIMADNVTATITATELAVGAFAVLTIALNQPGGATPLNLLQVNTQAPHSTGGSLAFNRLTVGADPGGLLPSRIQVAEIVGYTQLHDAATQLLVNQFLYNKYFGGGAVPLNFTTANNWLDNP